ncbi:MAG: hypothetical protein QOG84_1362 [Sphingomonadales bacterium]|nr:hypothetical protein [Sphingomonadales bacterium]
MKRPASADLAVEIPQVLSAAMAAGVFICIAQRSGNYLLHEETWKLHDFLVGLVVLVTIGAWNAKNFIDDFKAFARRDDEGFSLGPTVAFSAATFTTLGAAGTLLFDGLKAICALVLFFVLCSIWCATSWRRRSKKNKDDPEIPRRRIRMILYGECGTILALSAYAVSWVVLAIAAACISAVFVYDVRDYNTFSSSM